MILNQGDKKIWIDIINTPHVHFFHSLLSSFNKDNIFITSRQKLETLELLEQYGIENTVFGSDYKNKYLKLYGILARTIDLFFNLPKFDISISIQNGMSGLVSKARGNTCILFDDNDYRGFINDISLKLSMKAQSLADYYIVPKPCYNNFLKFIKEDKLISFDGYKEDISLSGFKPDPSHIENIPFDEFIVIRPEALDALYINAKSIVNDLIKKFRKENINIVLLSRDKTSTDIIQKSVYIPKEAVNGLDLCYYSQAVLTGSGTMAREAACMGVPAVSFFPGNSLLSVDKQLVDEKKMYHSRNPNEIVEYVLSQQKEKKSLDLTRSIKVTNEVIMILKDIIDLSSDI
jgi:predicted glycosyltransferase